ncbi:MAG: alpha/beta hydrolase [Anaerolineae bacterium]
MKKLFKVQVFLSTLLSLVPFFKPKDPSLAALVWLPKVMAGAFSPILALVSTLGALLGLARRDGKLAGAGILGVGLVGRYLRDISAARGRFEAAFGPDWAARLPESLRSRPRMLPAPTARDVRFQRNLVYGQSPADGGPLRADLWLPAPGATPTGLGVIYVHGGGWRIGEKDMLTRTHFRRLAGQGHAVLDVEYTLWPRAGIPTMVTEVNLAIRWLKDNGPAHGVDPERIVLMGGSAGAHLALLAAYTPGHPAFRPAPDAGDTAVYGVVAFYPPVDFRTMFAQDVERGASSPGIFDRAAGAMMTRLFMLQTEDVQEAYDEAVDFDNFVPALLGGSPDEIPETYELLSPVSHVGPHCPPTLLVHGRDDVFGLTPGVHRLHAALQEAGVPAVLVEFPHTDHGFDLMLPQISPVAQAAIHDVECFLALLSPPPVGEGP